MKNRRVLTVGALLLVLTLVLGACGGDGDDSDSEQTEENGGAGGEITDVKLRWNFIFDVTVAPYFLAQGSGAYEDAGFDVDILPGRGSLIAAQTVATGRDDYAIITADTAVQIISEGANLKIVAALQRSHPAALIHTTDVDIQTLQDLPDQDVILISGAGSSYHQALFGIMEEAGISRNSVEMQLVDYAAFAASYRNVDRAVVVGGLDSEAIAYKAFDPDVQAISLTELGLNMYGNVLVTSATRVAEDPEGVRAFVEATLAGLEGATEDPQSAVDAIVEAEPDLATSADTPDGLEQLAAATGLSASPSDPSAPLGLIVEDEFAAMVDFLSTYMGLKQPLEPEVYYTNEFIPE